jgi:hypothetical protein
MNGVEVEMEESLILTLIFISPAILLQFAVEVEAYIIEFKYKQLNLQKSNTTHPVSLMQLFSKKISNDHTSFNSFTYIFT